MSQEVELKLALNPDHTQANLAYLTQCYGAFKQLSLANTYYDREDLALAKARVAVRIRRDGDQYVQTLKTAGQAALGLHDRQELEMAIAGPELQLQPFIDSGLVPGELLHGLRPQFSTDFDRHQWQLEQDGSAIELVLDQGWVVAGQHKQAICELELELKSGSVAALWRLAEQLACQLVLMPFDLSKAQRGQALLAQRSLLAAAASNQDWQQALSQLQTAYAKVMLAPSAGALTALAEHLDSLLALWPSTPKLAPWRQGLAALRPGLLEVLAAAPMSELLNAWLASPEWGQWMLDALQAQQGESL